MEAILMLSLMFNKEHKATVQVMLMPRGRGLEPNKLVNIAPRREPIKMPKNRIHAAL